MDDSEFSKIPQIINIIGSRGSGKSTLIIDILSKIINKKNKNKLKIVSPQEKITDFYKSHGFTNDIIYDNPNDNNLLKFIVDIQNEYKNSRKENEEKDKNNLIKGCIVFDDCISSRIIQNELIGNLIYNSKIFGLTIIITQQYPYRFHPSFINNIDKTIIFQDYSAINRKRYYDYYGGMFPTFDSFMKLFEQITKELYTAIVLSKKTPAKFSDVVSWYKVDKTTNNRNDNIINGINELAQKLKVDLDGIVYATKLTIEEIILDMTIKVNSIQKQFEDNKNKLIDEYKIKYNQQVVNNSKMFNNILDNDESSDELDLTDSCELFFNYNNAKNSVNSILGMIPTNQQFGYSADPYGGLMASNLTTNPYNIDYLRRLGLI